MKVLKSWLQKYIVEPLPAANEIAVALTFHSFEVEKTEQIGDDWLFDIDILPHRAHNCLSHYGIAQEIALNFGLTLKPRNEIKLPESSKELEVKIEDSKLCRRCTNALIKGVKVGPSPEWLKNALEALGQRSINNIVDATNYIMLSIGEPTHVFDAKKLTSKNDKVGFSIEKIAEEKKITTLDGKEYMLKVGTLVHRDFYADALLDIAGVKGGMHAVVEESTTDIILEAANFDPVTVRKTGRGLGLLTDAQKRFENELTPELAVWGLSDLIALIIEIAGGIVEGYVDIYPEPIKEWNVQVSLKEINNVLGTELKAQEVEDIIKRFGWKHECVTVDGVRKWSITPPHERLDLKIKEDIIEEIGRIYGYEHIEAKIPEAARPVEINKTYFQSEVLRSKFVDCGYSEVYTYALRSKGEVELANPLASDKAFLRNNLKDGVSEALELNKKHKDLLGLKEIKLFEIGNVFTKDGEETHVCFANEKEVTEMTLQQAADHMKIAETGELPHMQMSENKYTPISPYPFIVRDIAVWIPDATSPEEITKIIIDDSGDLLVKGPTKFDQFSKEGRTSYAYRMVYQSMERTLTIEEVNEIINKITEKMNAREGWKVR